MPIQIRIMVAAAKRTKKNKLCLDSEANDFAISSKRLPSNVGSDDNCAIS